VPLPAAGSRSRARRARWRLSLNSLVARARYSSRARRRRATQRNKNQRSPRHKPESARGTHTPRCRARQPLTVTHLTTERHQSLNRGSRRVPPRLHTTALPNRGHAPPLTREGESTRSRRTPPNTALASRGATTHRTCERKQIADAAARSAAYSLRVVGSGRRVLSVRPARIQERRGGPT